MEKKSSKQKKMIQVRNLDLHKENKSIREGINILKITLLFLFLSDLKDNQNKGRTK